MDGCWWSCYCNTGSHLFVSMRVIVRSIMSELSPNSGSSLKDQVTRIEARLDYLYTKLIDSDHKIL
jgi:hypothetical protein